MSKLRDGEIRCERGLATFLTTKCTRYNQSSRDNEITLKMIKLEAKKLLINILLFVEPFSFKSVTNLSQAVNHPLFFSLFIHLFLHLLNFNYKDLNIQIVDKLTIKIN